jgi:hypothetical protein
MVLRASAELNIPRSSAWRTMPENVVLASKLISTITHRGNRGAFFAQGEFLTLCQDSDRHFQ